MLKELSAIAAVSLIAVVSVVAFGPLKAKANTTHPPITFKCPIGYKAVSIAVDGPNFHPLSTG
jgi:hypothetical protein